MMTQATRTAITMSKYRYGRRQAARTRSGPSSASTIGRICRPIRVKATMFNTTVAVSQMANDATRRRAGMGAGTAPARPITP